MFRDTQGQCLQDIPKWLESPIPMYSLMDPQATKMFSLSRNVMPPLSGVIQQSPEGRMGIPRTTVKGYSFLWVIASSITSWRYSPSSQKIIHGSIGMGAILNQEQKNKTKKPHLQKIEKGKSFNTKLIRYSYR